MIPYYRKLTLHETVVRVNLIFFYGNFCDFNVRYFGPKFSLQLQTFLTPKLLGLISASISQTVKNSRNVQISIFSAFCFAFCFKCRLLTQALTFRHTAVTARRQGPMTSFARLQYVPSATFLPPLLPIPPVLERENPTPRGSTRNACVSVILFLGLVSLMSWLGCTERIKAHLSTSTLCRPRRSCGKDIL